MPAAAPGRRAPLGPDSTALVWIAVAQAHHPGRPARRPTGSDVTLASEPLRTTRAAGPQLPVSSRGMGEERHERSRKDPTQNIDWTTPESGGPNYIGGMRCSPHPRQTAPTG